MRGAFHKPISSDDSEYESDQAQMGNRKSLPSHIPTAPRAARQEDSFDTLTKHYTSHKGVHASEHDTPEIHVKREAAMKDAEENYEIMMEFYREFSDAFEKIVKNKKTNDPFP